ncbi:SDR family NAD(P)-dependent oxidoreductase, partial [Mesorhizobium sp. M2D.F.Ca.ET.232.01.1.1]
MDYRSQFDLTGEVAVVTGGASGIGLEAARALGTCGARVVLLDMNADGLKAAAEALKAAGVASVEGRALDVTDPQAVEAMAAKVVSDFAQVDILVNSAGIAR